MSLLGAWTGPFVIVFAALALALGVRERRRVERGEITRRSLLPAQMAIKNGAVLLVVTALLALLIVPIGLSGALLPLLFHALRREMRDLGAVAGRLYAWNTIGSMLGALFGGYWLLSWLDLHHVYRVSVAALAIGAALVAGELAVAVAVQLEGRQVAHRASCSQAGGFLARAVRQVEMRLRMAAAVTPRISPISWWVMPS